LNAVQFFNNPNLGLEPLKNCQTTSPPQPDDIIVFAGPLSPYTNPCPTSEDFQATTAGHVAIATGTTGNAVNVIEQNDSSSGVASLNMSLSGNGQYILARKNPRPGSANSTPYSLYKVLGWMRLPAPPPTPVAVNLYPQYTADSYLGVFWSENNDADFSSYELYRATHSNVTTGDELVTTITDNSGTFYFRDTNLAANTYCYRMFVSNISGGIAGSNEECGRVFAPSEVLERIPGVPEPGDTTFPANVAVPSRVVDETRFDCTEWIGDPSSGEPSQCAGTYVAIGPVIESSGEVSKYRFFPTTVLENLSFNGIPGFEYILHDLDEFNVSLYAQDDSYTYSVPDYGTYLNISLGHSLASQGEVFAAGVSARTSPISLQDSAGVNASAGSLIVVP